jgi:hypothetical protein
MYGGKGLAGDDFEIAVVSVSFRKYTARHLQVAVEFEPQDTKDTERILMNRIGPMKLPPAA